MGIEMKSLDIDFSLWEDEVRKIKIKHDIYVDRFHANDRDFRRVALVLDDLFNKLFADKIGTLNLREVFYKMAKDYSLSCKPLPDFQNSDIDKDSVGKIVGNLFRDMRNDIRITNFHDFLSADNVDYSKILRSTRIALGLTLKTIEELPSAIDPDCLINFLSFLYRNCHEGFLDILKLNKMDLRGVAIGGESFFFDIRNGFSEILQLILNDSKKKLHSWQFYKCLFSTPISDPKTILNYPCIFMDIDRRIDTALEMEAKLNEYHILPSIRLKTSPRGYHFYWIFKKPVAPSKGPEIVAVQTLLGKYLGGDPLRCQPEANSRIASLFNWEYHPPHFISFEVTDYEYDLDYLLNIAYKFKNFNRVSNADPGSRI